MLIAFHKPHGVISQFTPDGSPNRPLSEFGFPKNVYPLGRLDSDSEGLLLLSDEPNLNTLLLSPKNQHTRTYWAQVEHTPTPNDLKKLEKGIPIGNHITLPCHATLLDPQPQIPERNPPIRFRKNIPTTWIALELHEGKNRQVRKMTAAIGFPTLRLIRIKIGNYELHNIPHGKWITLSPADRKLIFTS